MERVMDFALARTVCSPWWCFFAGTAWRLAALWMHLPWRRSAPPKSAAVFGPA